MLEPHLERAGARACAAGAALIMFAVGAPLRADEEPETITIVEPPPAEAASSVHLTEEELRARPRQTPSDVLRQTPGLLVGQHAGGGKADQLFLRGFDADHGTDVALFVDDVPVNLTSHGHGQGYADSHWIIPETIRAVDVHKGPYGARFGDFYTAGAIAMSTIDAVDGLQLSLSGGTQLAGPTAFENPTYRLVALASPRLDEGSALVATEIGFADGPFIHEQQFRRGIAFAKWRTPLGGGELALTTNVYGARWNQSGQIPAREVDAGRLDRFDAVDPTEGGEASRASLALAYVNGPFSLQLFGVLSRLRLYSNFTLFARDADHGDQIEQTDTRALLGLNSRYVIPQRWGGVFGTLTAGAQLRADDIDADLWHTARRRRVASCFDQGQNPCKPLRPGVARGAVRGGVAAAGGGGGRRGRALHAGRAAHRAGQRRGSILSNSGGELLPVVLARLLLQGRRRHARDHPVLLVEVLHRAVDDHVHDERLVADGLPPVDVARRLVDVAAGADDLAGHELPPPLEVPGVHIAGVAVAGDLGPRLEAQELNPSGVIGEEEQRLERLPLTERHPRHLVAVEITLMHRHGASCRPASGPSQGPLLCC